MKLKKISQLREENFRAIRDTVLKYYGLEWSAVDSPGRAWKFAKVRHFIMYFAYTVADDLSHTFIGEQFTNGRKDRSNVTRAINNMRAYIEGDKALKAEHDEILSIINRPEDEFPCEHDFPHISGKCSNCHEDL